MQITRFLPIMALAATAIADTLPIVSAMKSIQDKTIQLNQTVANWKGDLLGALPITIKSAELIKQLKESTETAEQSAPLTTDQALTVAVATGDLSKAVQSTLTTLKATKPKFDKLVILSPVVLINLEILQCETKDFSAAVVSKVPEALRSLANSLIKPIDDAFASAIATYKEFKLGF